MTQHESPDAGEVVPVDGAAQPPGKKKKSNLWAVINAVFIVAMLAWMAITSPPNVELSGWPALYAGLLVMSIAGEALYSRQLSTAWGKVVITPEQRPVMFWLIVSLLMVAGIRCALLFFH